MGSGDRMARTKLTLLLSGWLLAAQASAGQADVLQAEIQGEADGRFTIAATLRHADTGWSHYADRWEVIGPQGEILGKRVLWHPHEQEQPFTRSLAGVYIQPTYTWVKIRAHDSKHGYGGREVTLSVPH